MSPEEFALAARAYTAYGIPCGGRSAIIGDKLPTLDTCPVLPRAGWLAVVRYFAEVYGGPPPALGTSEERVEPFLMCIREIAGAARNLAEASQMTQSGPIGEIIESIAAALHERVTAFAPPTNEADHLDTTTPCRAIAYASRITQRDRQPGDVIKTVSAVPPGRVNARASSPES